MKEKNIKFVVIRRERRYKKSRRRRRKREKNPGECVISLVGINQKRKRNVISAALHFFLQIFGFGIG